MGARHIAYSICGVSIVGDRVVNWVSNCCDDEVIAFISRGRFSKVCPSAKSNSIVVGCSVRDGSNV